MIQGVINSFKSVRNAVLLSTAVLALAACGGAPGVGTSVGGDAASEPTISFDSVNKSELVLLGQGGDQDAIVVFKVSDASGDALQGVGVNFSLNTEVGGIQFSPAYAVSGSDGLVSVLVSSGSFPTTVLVEATIDQTATRAVSTEISISTSVFLADRFRLAAVVSDSVRVEGDSLVVDSAGALGGIPVTLQIIATDSFGHKVLDGLGATVVSPQTGLVTPSKCQMSEGICQVTWTSSDSGQVGFEANVIAYAQGAEFFVDTNGNNVYELGEAFTDLGEAYLDENDNGQYDLGEFYVDSERDGVFNQVYDAAGNGVWDGPCGSIVGEDVSSRAARCSGKTSTTIWDTLTLTLLAEPVDEVVE